MKNSQDVFESHMKAVDTLNASKVVEDYSDDALFITPEKTYKGKSEIFEFYNEFLPSFEGFQFKTIKQETNDSVVYFVWSGKNKHIDIQMAMDTYVVQNGKIKQHTFLAINN